MGGSTTALTAGGRRELDERFRSRVRGPGGGQTAADGGGTGRRASACKMKWDSRMGGFRPHLRSKNLTSAINDAICAWGGKIGVGFFKSAQVRVGLVAIATAPRSFPTISLSALVRDGRRRGRTGRRPSAAPRACDTTRGVLERKRCDSAEQPTKFDLISHTGASGGHMRLGYPNGR
jgi:hypothetical protein